MLTTLAGLVLGYVLSIPPIGPVAVLALRRVLQGEATRAVWLGVGTAIGDLPYVWLGAAGHGMLCDLPKVLAAFDLFAAGLLAALGVHMLRTPLEAAPPSGHRWGDGVTGLLLGLTNPTRTLSWAIAASLARPLVGSVSGFGYVAGVGLGQVAWWLTVLIASQYWGRMATGARGRLAMRGVALGGFAVAAWLAARAVWTWVGAA